MITRGLQCSAWVAVQLLPKVALQLWEVIALNTIVYFILNNSTSN